MMKLVPFLLLIILSEIFISCISNYSDNQIIDASLSLEKCITDTSNTYLLYIPSHSKKCHSMPLVLVIDPHGSGEIAIKKFITTADKYQCIVAASNLIKNNYPYYIKAIEDLKADLLTKSQFNGALYLTGFSGGARIALSYSELHPVKGVLACGALGTIDQINNIHARVYSLLGIADFNFPEVTEYVLYPEKSPSNLFIELSDLKHEWPEAKNLEMGLEFLMFNCIDKEDVCFSIKDAKKAFELGLINYIDSLISKNEYLKCVVISGNYLKIQGNENRNYFKTKYDSCKSSNTYKKEINQLQESLTFEMKVREAYYNSLLIKDSKWWKYEIDALDKHIENEPEKYTVFAYKRIRSFMGILCYSLTRNYLQSGDYVSVAKVLDVYKLFEPENPDMFFYTALYHNKIGETDEAAKFLNKALENGFTDVVQIKQNFPLNISEKALKNRSHKK